jgi:hypothetical protein
MPIYEDLEPHPLAEKIPEMPDEEYEELRDDILKNGLKEKIIVFEDMILDGRHRARALVELGLPLDEKVVDEYNPAVDGDAAAFVITRNICRRHLSKAQRVAAVLSLLGPQPAPKRGRPAKVDPDDEPETHPTDVPVREPKARGSATRAKEKPANLAELTGASIRTIERVRAVQRENPEAIAQIASGEKTLSQADRESGKQLQKRPPPVLAELIQKALGNDCGGVWIKIRGVIVAVAASSEAQEEFSSAHDWPLGYSDEP